MNQQATNDIEAIALITFIFLLLTIAWTPSFPVIGLLVIIVLTLSLKAYGKYNSRHIPEPRADHNDLWKLAARS